MKTNKRVAGFGLGLLLLMAGVVEAAEWQWSVDTQDKHQRAGKAFLWIPPDCDAVRGVFYGQHVALEQEVFQDPQIRAMCARNGLAILHVSRGGLGYDGFGKDGKGYETFNHLLRQFAEKSGYPELAQAPFVSIGHSGGTIWAWRMGYDTPERCIAVIGLRAAPISPPDHNKKAELNGVPVLCITGQFETMNPEQGAEHHWRWCRADILGYRAKRKNFLGSVLVQPGATHWNWDDKVSAYVCMFIEKAMQARVPSEPAPAGEQPVLKDLHLCDGWLTDHTLVSPPNFDTAAYDDYQGDVHMAFWHLDEELARANEVFGRVDGKKLQLISGLDSEGQLKPKAWRQKIDLKPLKDGITYEIRADFLTEAPPLFSHPEPPYPIGHAPGPIQFRAMGATEQVGPTRFRLRHDRFSLQKGFGLSVMAFHPGNQDYLYAEQPMGVNVPRQTKTGLENTITFDPLPDVTLDTKRINLSARSSSGLPVRFAVIEGPVRLKDNTLTLTKIPPRAKFPIRVTVTAYQWGRSVEPLVQSAKSIERSFLITKTSE